MEDTKDFTYWCTFEWGFQLGGISIIELGRVKDLVVDSSFEVWMRYFRHVAKSLFRECNKVVFLPLILFVSIKLFFLY